MLKVRTDSWRYNEKQLLCSLKRAAWLNFVKNQYFYHKGVFYFVMSSFFCQKRNLCSLMIMACSFVSVCVIGGHMSEQGPQFMKRKADVEIIIDIYKIFLEIWRWKMLIINPQSQSIPVIIKNQVSCFFQRSVVSMKLWTVNLWWPSYLYTTRMHVHLVSMF